MAGSGQTLKEADHDNPQELEEGPEHSVRIRIEHQVSMLKSSGGVDKNSNAMRLPQSKGHAAQLPVIDTLIRSANIGTKNLCKKPEM